MEPQAVIEIISLDMIELLPGEPLYSEDGKKLIVFDEKQGPFALYTEERKRVYVHDRNEHRLRTGGRRAIHPARSAAVRAKRAGAAAVLAATG